MCPKLLSVLMLSLLFSATVTIAAPLYIAASPDENFLSESERHINIDIDIFFPNDDSDSQDPEYDDSNQQCDVPVTDTVCKKKSEFLDSLEKMRALLIESQTVSKREAKLLVEAIFALAHSGTRDGQEYRCLPFDDAIKFVEFMYIFIGKAPRDMLYYIIPAMTKGNDILRSPKLSFSENYRAIEPDTAVTTRQMAIKAGSFSKLAHIVLPLAFKLGLASRHWRGIEENTNTQHLQLDDSTKQTNNDRCGCKFHDEACCSLYCFSDIISDVEKVYTTCCVNHYFTSIRKNWDNYYKLFYPLWTKEDYTQAYCLLPQ